MIGIVDGTEQLFEDNYDEPEQKYLIPWVQPDFQQFVPPLDENSLSAMPMVTHLSIPQVPANVEFQGMLNFNIKVTSAASSRNRWSVSMIQIILLAIRTIF